MTLVSLYRMLAIEGVDECGIMGDYVVSMADRSTGRDQKRWLFPPWFKFFLFPRPFFSLLLFLSFSLSDTSIYPFTMFALKTATNKAILPATRIASRRCASTVSSRSGKWNGSRWERIWSDLTCQTFRIAFVSARTALTHGNHIVSMMGGVKGGQELYWLLSVTLDLKLGQASLCLFCSFSLLELW